MSGCRCPECWSLREHMLEETGKDYGLAPAPAPHNQPRALVREVQADCSSMTCVCERCQSERTTRRPKPVKAFPWEQAA